VPSAYILRSQLHLAAGGRSDPKRGLIGPIARNVTVVARTILIKLGIPSLESGGRCGLEKKNFHRAGLTDPLAMNRIVEEP
jgi:hypothetical protein